MIHQRVVAGGSYEEMRKEAFETLLEVCGSIDVCSRPWRAVMFQDIPVSVSAMPSNGTPVSRTAVGMFVERRRQSRVSMGWIENAWRRLMRRYEPVIVVTPVFGHYGIRSIHVELMVNGAIVHGPSDFLTEFFYGKDVRRVKEFLEKEMPGLVI